VKLHSPSKTDTADADDGYTDDWSCNSDDYHDNQC